MDWIKAHTSFCIVTMLILSSGCDTTNDPEMILPNGDFSLSEMFVFDNWCSLPCFGGRASSIEDYFIGGTLTLNSGNYTFTIEIETRRASTGEVQLLSDERDVGTYTMEDSALVFNPQTSRKFTGAIINDSLRVYGGFEGLIGAKFDARFYRVKSDDS